MGLINFIKGQFIEVIEWTDSSADTIVLPLSCSKQGNKNGSPANCERIAGGYIHKRRSVGGRF